MHPENHYHLLQSGKMQCYLGFYNGEPMSTTAIMNDNGIASLEFVATLKDHRKKGLGGAVCRAAVDDAFKDGARIITLRTFFLGQPIYKSIGFKRY
jgi:ribosomal protein S18 acetylase RimI-like enzyme